MIYRLFIYARGVSFSRRCISYSLDSWEWKLTPFELLRTKTILLLFLILESVAKKADSRRDSNCETVPFEVKSQSNGLSVRCGIILLLVGPLVAEERRGKFEE